MLPRWLLPFLAIAAATAARAALHLSTPLVPGINGAYYLVQARSLLQKGVLAIPDLPLVFSIEAMLAAIIDCLTPLSQNEAILVAVKAADAFLPAVGVLPVLALAAGWAKQSPLNHAIAILAAILVPASGIALRMVGDFGKNSVGIALLCSLAWALHEWMNRPGAKQLAVAASTLALLGLTHIGVFGCALLLSASTLLIFAFLQGGSGWVKVGRLAGMALPAVATGGALVFWKFDPERMHRLLSALSSPATFLGPGKLPGPMGGPPMGSSFPLFAAAIAPGLFTVRRRRKELPPGTSALITGAAITIMALTGPWVQGDKVFRLQMNAAPLAWLSLLFAVLNWRNAWMRGLAGGGLFALLLLPSAFTIAEGGRPIVSPEAVSELRTIANVLPAPEKTLIVARHGLEWWTAWTLGTHIAQAQALEAQDWERYTTVCFLEEKRGPFPGPFALPFGPPGRGVTAGRLPSWLEHLLLPGMPGPPPGPDRRRPFPGPPPGPPFPGNPGGPPPGLMGAPIPRGAHILHDGPNFRLGEIEAPPDFVNGRPKNGGRTSTGEEPRRPEDD